MLIASCVHWLSTVGVLFVAVVCGYRSLLSCSVRCVLTCHELKLFLHFGVQFSDCRHGEWGRRRMQPDISLTTETRVRVWSVLSPIGRGPMVKKTIWRKRGVTRLYLVCVRLHGRSYAGV
jgi:hypothetical protein